MKNNIKLLIGFGIVVIAILLVSGCQKSQEKGEKGVIKIGVTAALTGKYAYIGISGINGMEMAIDKINANGGINGKKIDLIAEDNEGDPKEAATNVMKLMNVDNASIIISSFTHITRAIKDIVVDNGRLLFYISTDRTIAESSPYIFRDYFDAEDNGKAIAKAVKYFNKTNVSYIGENSDQCMIYKKTFEDEAKKLGINILSEEVYNVKETDLRTPLLKLDLKDSDALVTCTWRHEHILMKEMKELGYIGIQTFHWVGPYLPVAQTEEITRLFSENHAVSSWYGYNKDDPRAVEFINEYKQRYNEEPLPDAVYSYEDILMIAKALKKCDDVGKVNDRDCLRDALLNTKLEGVSGTFSFDKDGASNRDVLFIEAENNSWHGISIPN